MRLLITGASGLLGLNLAFEAVKDHEVFGVVRRHSLRLAPFKVIQGDLLDPDWVARTIAEVQPEWIVHCAALADVDRCERQPRLARRLNAELPQRISSLASRAGSSLLHISTDAVFDGERGGYTEEDIPRPVNRYGQTKLDGENAVLDTNPRAIVARINLFGWSLSGRRSLAEFFFNSLSSGTAVKGFTDVFFCPLHARALARILLQMLEFQLHGVYHVVSSDPIDKYAFGVSIARAFGLDEGLIQPVSCSEANLKATRSLRMILLNDRLTAALGDRPPTVSDGIREWHRLAQEKYPDMLHGLHGSPR